MRFDRLDDLGDFDRFDLHKMAVHDQPPHHTDASAGPQPTVTLEMDKRNGQVDRAVLIPHKHGSVTHVPVVDPDVNIDRNRFDVRSPIVPF